MEQKTYTEEEVQMMINRQRIITTFENVIDRCAPQMSKYEFDTCEMILRMISGAPAPTQAPAGTQEAATATAGGDTGEKYPD